MKRPKELEMAERNVLVRSDYKEYQAAGKKEKGEILSRLEAKTGLTRDHLAAKLRGWKEERVAQSPGGEKQRRKRKPRPEGKRGGRPVKYGPDFVRVLESIWADFGRQCGKNLKAMIGGMADYLAADPKYGIDEGMKAKLLSVSAAEIDILLKPAKKKEELRGISTTRAPSKGVRKDVPVQTHFNRDTVMPGDFAFDTVAHCGGSASGQFCKTLTGTDVYSGWIEERALLNAANRWVQEAIPEIKASLPFPLRGAHYDNGMEFMNRPLLDWCILMHIRATRSREYQKNDNCHAEQKNYDVVRKVVGYFRFDTQAEYEALAEVYKYLCPLYNYWYPSMKLIDKVKLGNGRYKKIYEKGPKTPYQRLIESPHVSDEVKAELVRRKAAQNPVELNRLLNEAVERLLQINREKDRVKQQPLVEGQKPDRLAA